MNKITKVIALALALIMCLALVACNNANNTNNPGSNATGSEIPSDLPAYKVGVILYDISNQWAKNILHALNVLGAKYNVTFEAAVGGTDPEQTIAAVENFGAAGYDGVLTLHPGAVMGKLVEICEANEMYIVSSNDPASGSADYADFSKSPYFAGEVWEDDYEFAYEIATDMIAKGAKKFALSGFPEGLAVQMDKRLQGARDAIAAGGAEIVVEGLSFNKAEAAQNIISQHPDIDAFFSSVETMSTVYQPIINAGLTGKILVNCYDPVDGLLEAMEDGVISYAVDGTLADSMVAFVLLYNAMSGNRMTQSDGSAASIQMRYALAKSAEEYTEILKYITGEDTPYTPEELAQFITAINKDASFDALRDFAGKFSLEDVKARHGA